MRVGLISCSKRKLEHAAPATELYQGDLFKLSKSWITVQNRIDKWAILSAKHGVVLPEQVIEPYDLALSSLSVEERAAWCSRVHDQLVQLFGRDAIYTIVAGAHYRAALHQLPYVQDVIACWTKWRREAGMKRPQMGLGVIKRELRAMRGYY